MSGLDIAGMGPGESTATGGVADYRLDRVAARRTVSGRWLDCGSCDGEYADGLAERGADRVVGVEIDPDRARRAAARPPLGDVRFVVAAAEALPFRDGSFDGVLLNEVLEHVADERASLAEIRRVMSTGAVLALFSPNRWFPFEGHGMTTRWWSVGFPVPLLPWLPARWTARVMQARNYWPHQLQALVRGADLAIMETGSAMPLLSHYRWAPEPIAAWYRANLSRLERHSVVRRFGVSTFILASGGSTG